MHRNMGRPLSRYRVCIVHAQLWLGLLLYAPVAYALDAQNVLVLYNLDSPESLQIAEYYAQVHPGVELLGLAGVSTEEQINQDHYLDVIRPQVLAGLHADTQVIVTTQGLPLRIKNNVPNPGTYPGWRGDVFGLPIYNSWWEPYSSLESELTRIDLIDSANMMGDQTYFLSPPHFPFSTMHQAANPYYNADQSFDRANPAFEGIRLTARLDGFNVSDVQASIDRAQTAIRLPTQQLVIVDDDPDAPATGVDRMAQLADDVLLPMGQAMVYDTTDANITNAPMPVIGYVSHGSHATGDEDYINQLDFQITDGAVFHTWESYNAFSFEQGNNRYGQGLVGQWLQAGGTAALGHVQEPGASASTVANEDILWSMLLQGYTLAEAVWAATPQLSYVNTVVGDPLMVLRDWIQGDVDLDGYVGLNDLSRLLAHWNQQTQLGVTYGDIDGDGYIGLEDLTCMLAHWNMSSTPPTQSVIAPEPSTVCLTLCGAAAWLLRRSA